MQTLIRWSWIFGLIGVLALFGAMATWWYLKTLDGAPTMFLVGGAVSLLLYVVLDRDRIDQTVRSRSFLYGSGSSLMVVMVAAIGVALYLLALDHDRSWDLTGAGDFTLSDHSRRVVAEADADIRVLAFYRDASEGQRTARDLMRKYQELNDRIEVEYVDPLRRPRLAEQHEVTSDEGVLVLLGPEGRERRIHGLPTEEKVTRALVVLASAEDHRICWSLGHGEPDPDDEFSERGMGAVVGLLDGLNYQVTKTYVGTTGIEDECDALIVARPQTDWFPYEREALAAYLGSGGRVLVMLEPWTAPGLAEELQRYGVIVGDDFVVDLNPKNQLTGVQDPSFVVLTDDNIRPHPITQNLGAAVVLPISRSAAAEHPPPEGLVPREVLRTSDQAWAETDPDAVNLQPDPGEVVGLTPVMVAVEIEEPDALEIANPLPEAAPPAEEGSPPIDVGERGRGVPADFTPQAGGRLVFIGDSDFANNVFVEWGNNRDLFLNSLAWLVDEEDQIGERPRTGDTLEMTQVGEAVLCLVSIFLVPGAAIFFGAATLMRRRFL